MNEQLFEVQARALAYHAEYVQVKVERDAARAEVGRLRSILAKLEQMIPDCDCDEAYKARDLTDPRCPYCNWFDDDVVAETRAILHQEPHPAVTPDTGRS